MAELTLRDLTQRELTQARADAQSVVTTWGNSERLPERRAARVLVKARLLAARALLDQIERHASATHALWIARQELAGLQARVDRLELAVRWALGEVDEFPQRPEPIPGKPFSSPAYWWRTEFRNRAFGSSVPEAGT